MQLQINPNQVGVILTPLSPSTCVFSFNNSEMANDVTLAFAAFTNIHAKYGIPNSSQFPDIGKSSCRGYFRFPLVNPL